MKKVYISPELFIEHVKLQHIICNSITAGGDAGVEVSTEDESDPVSGDSRRKNNVWDDEEEEW